MFDAHLIDSLVAGAMVFLALALTALLSVAWTLIPQVNRTLTAAEKLLLTLGDELPPTLHEVNKLMSGVGELKAIAGNTVSEVSTKVEDVTGNLTKAADNAKRHSSIWGAGLLAGAKAYLEGKSDSSRRHPHDS